MQNVKIKMKNDNSKLLKLYVVVVPGKAEESGH